jgi:LmbE family N-acetylglucosaminyl deacetylase
VEALAPHATAKLYHYTLRRSWMERVAWPRSVYSSPDDEITTVVDTSEFAEVRWRAIRAHDSQKEGPPFELLYAAGMFSEECFVRVFPSRRPGEPIETSLIGDRSSR